MPLIVMWALILAILVAASGNEVNRGEPNQTMSVDVVLKSSNLTPGLSFDLLEAGGNVIYSFVSNITVGSSFMDEITIPRGLYEAKIYNCPKGWSPSSVDVYIALSTSEDLLLLQTVYSSLENEVTSVSLDLTIPIGENEEWYVCSSAPEDWYSSDITGWEYQSIHAITGTALYFKKPFSLHNIETISSLVLNVRHISDCTLYLNGHLILEDDLSETVSQAESTSNGTESFKQYSFPITGRDRFPFLQETNWLAVTWGAHSDIPFDCIVMTLRGDHVMRLGDHNFFVNGSDIDPMTSLLPISAVVDNLMVGVTFPEERHEWVSSILLDLHFMERNSWLEFSVQARRSDSDPWVSLTTYRTSWKPTTLYWIPLNTTAWWSQFRLTDFRMESSSSVLTLSRMILVMDAPMFCGSLAYDDASLLTYQLVTLVPSSVFFSAFSVHPALPSGLSLDPRSGVIWGLPTEEVEQEFTVQARVNQCNVTTTIMLVIRPCEGDVTMISFYPIPSQIVMKSTEGSFFYDASILRSLYLDPSAVDRILDGEIHSSVFIPDHCQNVTITFDFGPFTRIFVNEYKFTVGGRNNAHHPSGWVFSGSVDGVEWTSLDVQSDQAYSSDYESRSFGFMNMQSFGQYRIQFTQCNNQPLPLQRSVSTGFELAETYLYSAPVGTCPMYRDASSRLGNGETRVVECASGFSGFVKMACRDSNLAIEDHCKATDLFQLSTPVLVVPYKRPFAVTPIIPFFDSLVYTFSPPLPSSIALTGIRLSGSYNNLTTTLFTVTAFYRHHFTSQQVLEVRVDTSPCKGVDGFNDTAHGEVGRSYTCPNNTEGYRSRACYSGQWEALEDHCSVVRPSLIFSPPSATGYYGDIVQLELKSSPQQATQFTLLNNLPPSLSLSETGVLSGAITDTVSLEVSAMIGTVSVSATTSITLLPRNCGDTPEGSVVKSACPDGQAGHVYFLCSSGQLVQRNTTCQDPAPRQFFYEKSRLELVVGRPFRLPYPRVTPKNVSFALAGSLPLGVNFEKETGALYGIPQVECPLRTFTVTAFNRMGRLETTLVISVEGLHCEEMQGVAMASIGTTRSTPCERKKGYGEMVYTCKEVEGKGEWVMEELCTLKSNYWRDFYIEMAVALCCTMGIVIVVCAFLVLVRLLLYRSVKMLPRNTFNIEMVNLSVKPVQSETK